MQQADKEYYNEFLSTRDKFLKDGWQQTHLKRDKEIVEAIFSKNGYSVHLLFGCVERIKDEVIL